ncbi:MAG: NUDIX hydrolase [Longicatena sp.]
MQKTVSSELVYEGRIFEITRDEVDIHDRTYLRDVVHHNGGVGVLAIRTHKILFVKQYRYAIGRDTLEIPAGKLEKYENPYTCGLRELEEETGYTSEKLEVLCSLYSTPGFCNEKIHLFYTDKLSKVENPAPMDEDEDIELLWIDIDKAYEMVKNHEIEDAKTIIAIQFAKLNF